MRLPRRLGSAAILIASALSAAYFANISRLSRNPAARAKAVPPAPIGLPETEPPPASSQAGNADNAPPIVRAARRQIGQTVRYDPAYTALDYPMGDVPIEKGVCSDVVIRALRRQGIDLQQLVHQDMKANFSAYPKRWGLKRPDPNIDHRRVPNLEAYFARQGWAVQDEYRAGDIVSWRLTGSGLPHIGIVSDRKSGDTPLIIHNIGAGTREEDILFRHEIVGHFRQPAPAAP